LVVVVFVTPIESPEVLVPESFNMPSLAIYPAIVIGLRSARELRHYHDQKTNAHERAQRNGRNPTIPIIPVKAPHLLHRAFNPTGAIT
jgi:hypothetical protein